MSRAVNVEVEKPGVSDNSSASRASVLNPRQRKFCDLIVAGQTAKAAYFESFPRCRSEKTAETEGCKLLKNPKVAQFIEALRWEVGEQAKSDLVVGLQETREFLAQIIRTPVGTIDEESHLCQSYKYTKGERSLKMPCKLRAAELNAKLAGFLKEPDKNIHVNTSVNVTVVTADQLKDIQKRKAAALALHGRN